MFNHTHQFQYSCVIIINCRTVTPLILPYLNFVYLNHSPTLIYIKLRITHHIYFISEMHLTFPIFLPLFDLTQGTYYSSFLITYLKYNQIGTYKMFFISASYTTNQTYSCRFLPKLGWCNSLLWICTITGSCIQCSYRTHYLF